MLFVCRRTVRGRSEPGHPADGETDTSRQVIIGIDYDYILAKLYKPYMLNRSCLHVKTKLQV